MLREIIVLAGEQEGHHLGLFLKRHNESVKLTHVQTREELTMALYPRREGLRLIAFCTSIIVPASALAEIDCGAYNVHPGPPTHPGKHPASFAIYDGATRFGATLHEMQPRVDSGPIVAVEWFDMPPEPSLTAVERRTFDACIRLWHLFGPTLATSPDPLPHAGIAWSGTKSTQRDFDRMCDLPPDIDAREFDLRKRAFADGLEGKLSVQIHGYRFRIEDKIK